MHRDIIADAIRDRSVSVATFDDMYVVPHSVVHIHADHVTRMSESEYVPYSSSAGKDNRAIKNKEAQDRPTPSGSIVDEREAVQVQNAMYVIHSVCKRSTN